MPKTWSKNLAPTTGSQAVFNIKTALKAAGATIPKSSDGTTVNTSGVDQISHSGAGTGGLANTSAWFVMTFNGRHYCIQRGSTHLSWWVRVCHAGFTVTTGTNTVAPLGSDERNLLGTSATGAAWFGTDNTYQQHIMVNTDNNGFWSVGYPTGGGVDGNHIFLCDPMLSGTYPTEDIDPYVYWATGTGTVWAKTTAGWTPNNNSSRSDIVNGVPLGYLKKGLAGEGFVSIPMCVIAHYSAGTAVVVAPGFVGPNPHTGKDDYFPQIYGRSTTASAPVGIKGVSSLIKLNGASRACADVGSIATSVAKDKLLINGAYALDWDGTDPV